MKLDTFIRWTVGCSLAGGLLAALVTPLQAETITIGKGRGIMWEGLPFSETMSGPLYSPLSEPRFGLLSISKYSNNCMPFNDTADIAGYRVYPFPGISGVGIIPRANASATFVLNSGTTATLNGTIGLPETAGVSSAEGEISSIAYRPWCIPATNADRSNYYSPSANRTVRISGTWAIVADGTQKSAEISIPPMYFGSYSSYLSGDLTKSIFPSNIILRVSTLECTVTTSKYISFGNVTRNSSEDAQLAKTATALTTSCGQPSNFINANINVQFRALTGLYQGNPRRLALEEGGGYITGEIDKGVTPSGSCSSDTGVSFDNTPIKIGNIRSDESNKYFSHNLTWRLCSGGSNLPSGKVNAAAEMLVTFN